MTTPDPIDAASDAELMETDRETGKEYRIRCGKLTTLNAGGIGLGRIYAHREHAMEDRSSGNNSHELRQVCLTFMPRAARAKRSTKE